MRPWLFIGMWLIFFIIIAILSMIPVISLFSGILTLVFTAGIVASAAKVDQGEWIGIGGIFTGFSKNFGTLCGVGALYLLFSIVAGITIVIPMALFFFATNDISAIFSGQFSINDENTRFFLMLMVLVYLAILIPLIMSIFFAPALIIQHDVGVWQAMSLSFKGCLRNILPFLVYVIIAFGLLIIAILPLFLGLFVLFPMLMLTFYTAYKDIFLHVGRYEADFVA